MRLHEGMQQSGRGGWLDMATTPAAEGVLLLLLLLLLLVTCSCSADRSLRVELLQQAAAGDARELYACI